MREFALWQRRHVPVSDDERLNARAGYPLGLLHVRGVIDERLHDAGTSYRAAFVAWRGIMGFPALGIGAVTPGDGEEPPPDLVTRLKERFEAADRVLTKCGNGVRALVSNVAIADRSPEPDQIGDLVAGLTALARHFRIPDRAAGSSQRPEGWRDRHRSLAGQG
jgi:hypothetical protein